MNAETQIDLFGRNKEMQSPLVFCMKWFCVAALLFISACDTQSPVSPDVTPGHQPASLMAGGAGAGEETRYSPVYSDELCLGESGIAYPDSYIKLEPSGSRTKYLEGSVPAPTLVSFDVCDLDNSGTPLAPKMAIFGPSPTQTFRLPLEVRIDKRDAGIDGVSNGTDYHLFRLDDITLRWEYVLSGQVEHGECRYGITRNGTYAVSLVDSVSFGPGIWTTTGLITPLDGGTLNLLSSSFSVEPGAIASPTMVTFTIIEDEPTGLGNPIPRIYEFGPEGTTFSTPAVMTIDYADAGYDRFDDIDEVTYLYYFDPDQSGGTWVRQPQPVERSDEGFVVELHHFSRYAFGR